MPSAIFGQPHFVGVGIYPHNNMGRPVRPLQRWETRVGHGNAPADSSWAFHQPHIWLDGQDPESAEFIDVAWPASGRNPWSYGDWVELPEVADGGPVVHADGAFAVVNLRYDLFVVVFGHPEGYCNAFGSGDDSLAESAFETLALAVATIRDRSNEVGE